MTDNIIYIKDIPTPPVDKREVLRYAGVRESDENTELLLDQCINEVSNKLAYKVCYGEFDISFSDDAVDLGFAKTTSASLRKRLDGCNKIILFCASVGVEIDRLITRYSIVSPSRAVILQALGSERVEALCDAFCEEVKGELKREDSDITHRFSPGYGDLPLALQSDIFLALNPTKRLGVVLNDNLFMSPSKTVTAIIGIKM